MASDSRDYIGGGADREWWMPGGGAFSIRGTTTELILDVGGGPSGSGFTFDIAAAPGRRLRERRYDRAQRTPFREDGRPGLDISGEGRGCNEVSGWFVVHDIHFHNGVVDRVNLHYEQHCEGGEPAAFGQISINEPRPDGNLLVMPGRIRFSTAYRGATSSGARVRLANLGDSTLHPGSPRLAGRDPRQFRVRYDGCSGAAVASGSSCLVSVRFKPSKHRHRPAAAQLRISADPSMDVQTVPLAGRVFPGKTYWRMHGDAGDYILRGNDLRYSPRNAAISARGTAEDLWFAVTSGDDWWYADFTAGSGNVLAPGDYKGARRASFSGTAPGIDVYGDDRGCNEVKGSFHVYQYVIDPATNELSAVRLSWEQHCEGAAPAAYGVIAWHATE